MTAPDDIRAGDVVVARSSDDCRYSGTDPHDRWSDVCGTTGRLFRVAGTASFAGLPIVQLAGLPDWCCAGCVERVEAAEPCFTEAMQRLIEPAPAKPSIVAELHRLKFGRF